MEIGSNLIEGGIDEEVNISGSLMPRPFFPGRGEGGEGGKRAWYPLSAYASNVIMNIIKIIIERA